MPLNTETQHLLTNLISALEIEIENVKGRTQRIEATNGILVESIGNLYIYKFSLKDIFDIPDDTDVLIRIDNSSHKAVIVNCKGLELLLSCEVNLGQTIPSISIHISNANLLESLKKLLEQIQSQTIRVNEDLLLKLFGINEPIPAAFPEFYIPPLKFELDEFQKDVITKSLNSEISFIWGPPGTGKTAVIAVLTKILIDAGLSVFITSNTNVAVDNAFDKFIQFFRETSDDLLNGRIIRYGNIQVEGIKEYVQEANITKRLAEPLFKEINQLTTKISTLQSEKNKLKQSIEDYRKYSAIKTEFESRVQHFNHLSSKFSNTKSQLHNIDIQISNKNEEIAKLYELLLLSNTTNSLLRLFKGIKSPKSITKEIRSINSILSRLSIDKNKLLNTSQSLINELKQVKSKLDALKADFVKSGFKLAEFDSISISDIERKINGVDVKIYSVNEKINEIKSEIEKLEKELISNAKVIGTTLSMFHSKSKLYSRNYDIVIIDEVTMAILPQLFFASGFANKKVFIVGDFMQLQSIIKTKDSDLVNNWIKADIFSKNNIKDGSNPKLNTLCIQRRMNPAIAEITNQCLYNGILQHLPIDSPLADEPAVSFYDTSKFSPYATIPGKSGRINIYNAVLAVKLTLGYLEDESIKDIGIITPYRKQANLLAKLIRDADINNKAIADTVHKFQGLERDLIIFDITDGKNSKNYSVGAHLRDSSESPNLFNVAFTRAKKKLIIIGDMDYLRENRNQFPKKVRDMFNVFLNTRDNNYEIIDSTSILDTITILNDESLPPIIQANNNILHFSEQTFYQDFLNEIKNCQKSLKIFSPFIAPNRIRNNFNDVFFQQIINRNVKIDMITKSSLRHPNPDFSQSCIDRWRQLGVKIKTNDDMHEKIAIIDNRVIYIGSLNILSQWQSSETMLKIEGPDSIKELVKIYNNLY